MYTSTISKTRLVILLGGAAVLGLVIGLLIGGLAINSSDDDDGGDGLHLPGAPSRLVKDGDPNVRQMIQDGLSAKNIEDNLRNITRKPHLAGTQPDYDLVKLLRSRWEADGLKVQTTPYDILLSYPNLDTPNSVRILDGAGQVVYDSVDDESDITDQPGVVPPFHAYSPKGLVTGELVFASFGRDQDYEKLQELGVDVQGKVVIVRYGWIFRGDKVEIASRYGATGVIMYSDPHEATGQLMGDDRVYPETWWLPGGGAQRGAVLPPAGDPLTPGTPANNLAYRQSLNDTHLPPIPSHPIGYGAAYHLLKDLGGQQAPNTSEWQGGLNFTYHIGPGFANRNWRIQLNVTNVLQRKLAENVFAIIPGAIEPDRYVMMGNHRDSWIYGAVDPSSGTAVMMEVSRVMAALVREGKWKPRRSIMFCSWGAQEYGLIGSTEWVEQYVSTLRERAVAYINVDLAVMGNDSIRAIGSPLLYHQTYETTKLIPNPKPEEVKAGRTTVYDSWLKLYAWTNNKGQRVPLIYPPPASSDYAPLIQMAGVPVVDLTYDFDKSIYKVPFYPVYHTEYETFQIVKEQMDKDFETHKAMASVVSEMIRSLSDSLVLPFKVKDYADGLETNRKILEKAYGQKMRQMIDTYDDLELVIANFSRDAEEFENRISSFDKSNPYVTRQVNDQMMLLERAFLSPEGLPLRPMKKHLIIAENANDAYAGTSFPGLDDLLFQIDQEPSRWTKVKQHFALLVQTIQTAGCSLRDVTQFMVESL